jgi:hypothetical protein
MRCVAKTPDEQCKEQVVSRTQYVRRLKIEQKSCLRCGKVFEGIKKQRYCSRACQAKADYDRHAEQYRKARRERYQEQKTN